MGRGGGAVAILEGDDAHLGAPERFDRGTDFGFDAPTIWSPGDGAGSVGLCGGRVGWFFDAAHDAESCG